MISETPRDVANIAEAHVVGLTQTALALLLDAALQHGDEDGSAAFDLLQQSKSYLASEFMPAFEAAAEGFSQNLAGAQGTLVAALTELTEALPDVLRTPDAEAITQLGNHATEALQPAVLAFLGALFDTVVACEKAAALRARQMDSSGLDKIDTMSQTINFIAINASVEAARAGDAGRGFAVIASQIRELSQKSKEAVDQIRAELAG